MFVLALDRTDESPSNKSYQNASFLSMGRDWALLFFMAVVLVKLGNPYTDHL